MEEAVSCLLDGLKMHGQSWDCASAVLGLLDTRPDKLLDMAEWLLEQKDNSLTESDILGKAIELSGILNQ